MNNKIKAALSSLDLAISLLNPPPKTEDEFTLVEYMKKANIKERTALSKLAQLVSDGSFVKRKILIDGRFFNLYRKA